MVYSGCSWAHGSVGERLVHTEEVRGSNPRAPTKKGSELASLPNSEPFSLPAWAKGRVGQGHVHGANVRRAPAGCPAGINRRCRGRGCLHPASHESLPTFRLSVTIRGHAASRPAGVAPLAHLHLGDAQGALLHPRAVAEPERAQQCLWFLVRRVVVHHLHHAVVGRP